MTGTYKVTDINLGDTAFQLGNGLTVRRSRDGTYGMQKLLREAAQAYFLVRL